MTSTQKNGQAVVSYEVNERETLAAAKRIYALPDNATAQDVTPAQVKDLSTMILSLIDLKNDEGYYSETVLQKLGLMYDGARMAGNSAQARALQRRKRATYLKRSSENLVGPKSEPKTKNRALKPTKPKSSLKSSNPYAVLPTPPDSTAPAPSRHTKKPKVNKTTTTSVETPKAKPLPKLGLDANITIVTNKKRAPAGTKK